MIYTQIIPSFAIADPVLPANNATQAPTGVSAANLQNAENAAQANVDNMEAAHQLSQQDQPLVVDANVNIGDSILNSWN